MCFVCTGNTCRSPIAQYILKDKAQKAQFENLRITSYGTNVTETTINPLARAVLKRNSIKLTKFTPKQITLDKVKGFGAIVAMTDNTKNYLEEIGYKNVYSINQLTKLGDVVDPYGGDMTVYQSCFEQLDKACTVLIDMLKQVL